MPLFGSPSILLSQTFSKLNTSNIPFGIVEEIIPWKTSDFVPYVASGQKIVKFTIPTEPRSHVSKDVAETRKIRPYRPLGQNCQEIFY